jgi:predicted nuclease of predicted toxin-antitoxin system
MRFLVDAQLPPALARLLTSLGHDSEHVMDRGLHAGPDSGVWDHAVVNGFVILTKDEDFPQRRQKSETGPVVVWIRVGNTSRRALLEWFEPLPKIEVLIGDGDTLIEIR